MSNILFSKTDSEKQDDVWDDTALIRAYDRSVKLINQKLNDKNHPPKTNSINESHPMSRKQEIAEQEEEANDDNNELDEEDDDDEDEVDADLDEEQEEEYDEAELDLKQHPYETNLKKREIDDWKAGDLCNAIYSEDGLLYKAEIITIFSDKDVKKCIVRYLYYLNEEEKFLTDLYEANEPVQETNEPIKQKKSQTSKIQNILPFKGISIPPPPPPSLSSFQNLKQSNTSADQNEEELHTMLMSWYMSGYHTGYYFGMKQANDSVKANNKLLSSTKK